MDERIILRYATILGIVGVTGLVLVWIFASPQLTNEDSFPEDLLISFFANVDTITPTKEGAVFSVSRVCQDHLYVKDFTDDSYFWEQSLVEVVGRSSGDFFNVESIKQIS